MATKSKAKLEAPFNVNINFIHTTKRSDIR